MGSVEITAEKNLVWKEVFSPRSPPAGTPLKSVLTLLWGAFGLQQPLTLWFAQHRRVV